MDVSVSKGHPSHLPIMHHPETNSSPPPAAGSSFLPGPPRNRAAPKPGRWCPGSILPRCWDRHVLGRQRRGGDVGLLVDRLRGLARRGASRGGRGGREGARVVGRGLILKSMASSIDRWIVCRTGLGAVCLREAELIRGYKGFLEGYGMQRMLWQHHSVWMGSGKHIRWVVLAELSLSLSTDGCLTSQAVSSGWWCSPPPFTIHPCVVFEHGCGWKHIHSRLVAGVCDNRETTTRSY